MVSREGREFPDESMYNDHALATLQDRLEESIGAVERRLALHPASRVSEWRSLLAEFGKANRRLVIEKFVESLNTGTWAHPHKQHLRALLEVREFIEIIEQLADDLNDADLRDLISGTLDPADEKQKSRARDRGFELFVAAVCRRAGLTPTLSEPDIVVDFAGSKWAIAAKRLSSPKRVSANVSKAASQIKRSGHLGFVFLDVTRILEPKYEFVTHWRTVSSLFDKHLLAFVNNDYAAALQKADNGRVRGIVLRTAFPHMSEGLRLGTSENWWAVGLRSVDGSELNQFLKQFSVGLRGL